MDNDFRIGICKHTLTKVLQVKDEASDDAIDEPGWLCVHRDTLEEEIEEMINFKYNLKSEINPS